jgi:hypothetical protein
MNCARVMGGLLNRKMIHLVTSMAPIQETVTESISQSLRFMVAVLMQHNMRNFARRVLLKGQLRIDHFSEEVGFGLGEDLGFGLAGTLHE